MKKMLLCAYLICFNSFAFELTAHPVLGAGLRLGSGDVNNKPAGYVSGKMSLIEQEVGTFKTISILSPSLNYQTDGNISIGVSPISIRNLNGLTIGIDVFKEEKNVNGGIVGVFIGITF